MNELDYIFGETNTKDVHKAVIDNGYITQASAVKFYEMVKSKEFRGMCSMLTVMSDRKGRTEQRMEDAYASFPIELERFLKNINTKLTSKGKK